MKPSKLYWVETGDYLQIGEGSGPKDAVKHAFLKKEPTKAGRITEVRPLSGEETTFFVDTVEVMRSIGFQVE